MAKFQEKSGYAEAVRLLKSGKFEEVPEWLQQAIDSKTLYRSGGKAWAIRRPDRSILRVYPGDWIVCDADDNYVYALDPDTFTGLYEPIKT